MTLATKICNFLFVFTFCVLFTNAAIEIFKQYIIDFPNSWNVYDSMGEAYMKKGKKRLAIENYEKSVSLNPNNEDGKEILKKLKSGN